MVHVLVLVFALSIIVYMIKKKRPLYLAMLLGIITLAVSMGKPPATTLTLLWQWASKWETVELVLAVGLLSLLSRILKDLGFLENFMQALVSFLKSTKVALVIIPALIGIFPVLGGAIFSAPLVDTLGDRLRLSASLKTSINLIFRHAVFYCNPFNPALILLAGLTGLDILSIIKYLFPLGIVNIIVGYYLYLYPIKVDEDIANRTGGSEAEPRLDQLKKLVFFGTPLFLSLFLFVLFRVNLLISIVIGIIAAFLLGDLRKGDFKTIFTRGPDPLLMLGIWGIMIFQSLVRELDGLFIVVESFTAIGIPNFLLFIVIPFLIGWVSAAAALTVGITVPILFPLLQSEGGEVFYAMLLYASGFFSYYISPIHLCQIVSSNYFRITSFNAYRLQYPVLFITYLCALVIFVLGVYVF